jgi:L-arabinose isomerase
MKVYGDKEVWLVTGSQDLYGPGVLKQVAANSQSIAAGLTASDKISVKIVAQDTVKSPSEILAVCQAANSNPNCVGLILWMHTFSPAKMWISGLRALSKPYMHLHTQFNAELPFAEINMNFMNLNQSAHGDREFGHVSTRLRQERKVVVGHWATESVQKQIDSWCRVAMGWYASQNLKVARFGDNMRQVAVTDGDKVSAQITFGYEVHAYGLGDLQKVVDAITDEQVAAQIEIYKNEYDVNPAIFADEHQYQMLKNEARLELGMLKFLTDGGFGAFTNCFENLTGLTNLPGLATQRLMNAGFGYGGEGDWKTAAMVHICKVISKGRVGGSSFMEDYTYHFGGAALGGTDQVLGAHMLEVCPSIAAAKPKLEVHLHTIGCRNDIARLIFTGKAGPALCISLIDIGTRFRVIINEVDTVTPAQELPKLPVAKALWEPRPNLEISAAAWIQAGGAHHSAYTQGVTADEIVDYAEIAGIEAVVIDADTTVRAFKTELRHNAAYYHLKDGV